MTCLCREIKICLSLFFLFFFDNGTLSKEENRMFFQLFHAIRMFVASFEYFLYHSNVLLQYSFVMGLFTLFVCRESARNVLERSWTIKFVRSRPVQISPIIVLLFCFLSLIYKKQIIDLKVHGTFQTVPERFGPIKNVPNRSRAVWITMYLKSLVMTQFTDPGSILVFYH